MGYVGARDLYSNYKASECKRTIIRLHCATSKSSLWNMEYVARDMTWVVTVQCYCNLCVLHV